MNEELISEQFSSEELRIAIGALSDVFWRGGIEYAWASARQFDVALRAGFAAESGLSPEDAETAVRTLGEAYNERAFEGGWAAHEQEDVARRACEAYLKWMES